MKILIFVFSIDCYCFDQTCIRSPRTLHKNILDKVTIISTYFFFGPNSMDNMSFDKYGDMKIKDAFVSM